MKIEAKELMEAPKWTTRHDLPHILNDLKLLGHGVEIGVQRGVFGSHIRSIWDGVCYIGVDPWKKYFSVLDTQEMHDQYRENAINHLAATGKQYKLHRMTAMEFVDEFHGPQYPGQYDWIYLDGDHSYGAVMEEIERMWPLVRPGGIFAFHDVVPDGWHRNGDPFNAYATEAEAGEVGHCGIFEVERALRECFPWDMLSITSPDTDYGWKSAMVRRALVTK